MLFWRLAAHFCSPDELVSLLVRARQLISIPSGRFPSPPKSWLCSAAASFVRLRVSHGLAVAQKHAAQPLVAPSFEGALRNGATLEPRPSSAGGAVGAHCCPPAASGPLGSSISATRRARPEQRSKSGPKHPTAECWMRPSLWRRADQRLAALCGHT